MPAPASPVRVIQMGLGPIGQRVVQYLVERRAVQLAAAIDIDPAKVGRDAGELCGVKPLGVAVTDQVAAALATPAEVVLLTTGSTFAKVVPQIEQCLRAGKSVVSTCEELAFPWDRDPALARRVDQLARERGAVVLGTGVNPGFLMDALPIFLTSVCRRVDRVRVERHQDAAQRRLPFQQKIGAGLTPAEFEQKRAAGVIRHVGFEESIRMVARALGWTLERVEEIVQPVIAQAPVESSFLQVAAGQCAGVHQVARGYVGGKPLLELELQAYLGHPDPRDTVRIDGDPPIHSTVAGGVNGDVATCAIVLNALKSVRTAAPGLRTMADVPVTHWW